MNTFKIWRGTPKNKKKKNQHESNLSIVYIIGKKGKKKTFIIFGIKEKEKYNTDKILFLIFNRVYMVQIYLIFIIFNLNLDH